MNFNLTKQWWLLGILFFGFIIYFLFGLNHYLTFAALQQHRQELLSWTKTHYVFISFMYMVIYIFAVAISIPGAIFLTLLGGFLFGMIWGTCYVVISATLGATIIFLAVRYACEPWIAKKTNPWVKKMRVGFQQNAFQYLLFLRFIPLFPFWIVNIVPALLGVQLTTFIAATLIGIIPGSFIYVAIGNGLGHILDQNQLPDLHIIFEPIVLLPLIGLALLSILPIIYRWIVDRMHGSR